VLPLAAPGFSRCLRLLRFYTALGGLAGSLTLLVGYGQSGLYGFLGLALYAIAKVLPDDIHL
jgi:hypothetical protein